MINNESQQKNNKTISNNDNNQTILQITGSLTSTMYETNKETKKQRNQNH